MKGANLDVRGHNLVIVCSTPCPHPAPRGGGGGVQPTLDAGHNFCWGAGNHGGGGGGVGAHP